VSKLENKILKKTESKEETGIKQGAKNARVNKNNGFKYH